MDRGEAAVLLGIADDAAPAEVRAAFRRSARSTHPDTAPGATRDLGELTQARDRLLEPRAGAEESASATSARVKEPPTPDRRSIFGFVWAIAALVVAVAVLTLVVIFVIAAVAGDDTTDQPPAGSDAECLIVGATTVEPVSCAVEGAQRLVGELTEGGVCPAGTNTLGAGSKVWCLEPASR